MQDKGRLQAKKKLCRHKDVWNMCPVMQTSDNLLLAYLVSLRDVEHPGLL